MLETTGFEKYCEPLNVYLSKYREKMKLEPHDKKRPREVVYQDETDLSAGQLKRPMTMTEP